jgi:hypothetical protein
MHIGYWWESQKEKIHLEDQDICGWIILKLIRDEWVVLTGLIWLRIGTSGDFL